MNIYILTYKQINNMGEIIKVVFAMIIYLYMLTIVTNGKFIITKKKKKTLNLILNVSSHVANNFFYFLFIIIAVTICDSDQDCRRYRCDPPEYPRCLGILCKCVYVSG